jgi:hypothetical protein
MDGTWLYRQADGLADYWHRHEGPGDPPDVLELDGTTYERQWQVYDPLTDSLGLGVTMAVPVRPSQRDGRFESHQACRNDPLHKGEFSKDGKPRFTSRSEAHEYARRVSGETGVDMKYGQL